MSLTNETLQRIISEYGGFDLTPAELDLLRPELESYLNELQNLRELDLSNVPSARLLRAAEGDETNA